MRSLSEQDYPVKEVIVVDASDAPPDINALRQQFPGLNIFCLTSEAAVCIQRNKGIRRASSPHIFLCDDDMELPADYISRLMFHIRQHPQSGAVSGLVVETGRKENPTSQFPAISFKNLLWNFLFQLTVWADLKSVPANRFTRLPLSLMKRFYTARGNNFTLAGWPLISNFGGPFYQTAIYGLGASIIRREWLLKSPFDEILDRHGIGDNYGVAVNFPQESPITVLTNTHAFHHKISDNRLPSELVYFRRILALHYFMVKSKRFSALNRGFLRWSLVGNWLSQILREEKKLARVTARALKLIVTGRNPYLLAWRKRESGIVEPEIE
jgi:GT2 family glycosyltransferase